MYSLSEGISKSAEADYQTEESIETKWGVHDSEVNLLQESCIPQSEQHGKNNYYVSLRMGGPL